MDRNITPFALGALLITFAVLATATEVSSVRDSQYEWQCETEAGVVISGHTRQDKAFQSCFNQALATGDKYIVRGGTYRVTVSGATTPPPVEPPVEPPPPDGFLVSFGPLTSMVTYPADIAALKQRVFRWEITFTLNSVGTKQGLASRDELGQAEKGHLSVWVDEAGIINVRHQDIAGGASGVRLASITVVIPGREYLVVVSIDKDNGSGLFVDGVLEATSPVAFGLADNNLPLVVGGMCQRCTADGVTGPTEPIDGTVYMEIWDEPLALPTPIVGSVILRWISPTEYEDGTPLPAGIPDRISIYETQPRQLVSHLDGESIAYEVTGLAGGEHCFVGTAWHMPAESIDSNVSCKTVQ